MEDKNQQILSDILDTVIFIKDNAVSKTEFNELKSEVSDLKSEFGDLKSEVGTLSGRVGRIESQMVTKDYLDNKLADLRGDLVVLTRKEDTKLRELIEILANKNVLNKEEANHLKSLEPFPQLM